MSINGTQATPEEMAVVDERHHLGVTKERELVQAAEQLQDHGALPDRSESQFFDHGWVRPDLIRFQ